MTSPSDRIEAAARAMAAFDDEEFDDMYPSAQGSYRRLAKAALASAYPELTNGTAWIAPMQATEAMAKHAEGYTDFGRTAVVDTLERVIKEWQMAFSLMRDAYPHDQPKDRAG